MSHEALVFAISARFDGRPAAPPRADEERGAWLGRQEFRAVRFPNTEVLEEMQAALTEIQNRL